MEITIINQLTRIILKIIGEHIIKKNIYVLSVIKKLLNTEKIKRHELSHLCSKAKNKKLETEKQDLIKLL